MRRRLRPARLERRADEAEREAVQDEEGRVHAEHQIGKVFDGIISGTDYLGHVCGASQYRRRHDPRIPICFDDRYYYQEESK